MIDQPINQDFQLAPSPAKSYFLALSHQDALPLPGAFASHFSDKQLGIERDQDLVKVEW